ncbi:MAG TPA: hypothetical protein VN948_00935 [Terriglobales bacterium]|nr:hypothetical protein [Terriglobales bacterium]
MNRELAQLVGGRRNRWYGDGVSVCLARLKTGPAPRKQALNWDKVLGLATVLVVVALGWTAVGFAVSHFLR